MAPLNAPWTTIAELLETSYRRFSSRIAVQDERGSLTYKELRERSIQIAANLAKKGVRQGDRVALIINNRSEYVQVEHAVALGGFVRVCAITRLHSREVAHILADAQPAYAFIEESWLANAEADFLKNVSCPVVVVGCPADSPLANDGRLERFESFASTGGGDFALPSLCPADLAWLMYTSGSTGTPKGVVHTHRSITAMIRNILSVMRTTNADDVAVHTAPLSHFSGAIAWALFAAGSKNVLLERFQPQELFRTVSEVGATILPLVPVQLNIVADYLRHSNQSTANIRMVPYAGSAIPPDKLAAAREFFGAALVQFYGATEAPMPITALYPEEHVDTRNELGLSRFASAGSPIAGVEVSIRDNENHPVMPGTVGEIAVRSPANLNGYWRNKEATDEILEADGFVHTGDLGLLDSHGFLFIVDRKKDMIVTGGFNVFPRELENVISAMPGVQEVAVVSAPDEKWGETIVAVVALQPGSTLTLEQVQAQCRDRLAGYKMPRKLEIVDALPKTSTGKIQKRSLQDRYWAGRQRRVGG